MALFRGIVTMLYYIELRSIWYPLYIVSYCDHCTLYYIVYCLVLYSLSIALTVLYCNIVCYCTILYIVSYCPLYHIVYYIIFYIVFHCTLYHICCHWTYCISLYIVSYCHSSWHCWPQTACVLGPAKLEVSSSTYGLRQDGSHQSRGF